jgi:RNA polymerase sigma-70 factor (ECF subfamily)
MAAGDRDAALALIRRHQARVYGLARSVVRDVQLAEDVSQEAFLRAWRHATAYDPRRGAVLPWLLTITRNAAIDHVRARRVRPEVPVDLLPEILRAIEPGPGDQAVTGDDSRRTLVALRGLPDPQRRAVLFATYAGFTAAEVSEIEGIPLGTAKTRIRTGLARLRAVLIEEVPS